MYRYTCTFLHSVHLQVEGTEVSTNDGFEAQQVLVRLTEEAWEEVALLKQNLQLNENLLKVTTHVGRMESDNHGLFLCSVCHF